MWSIRIAISGAVLVATMASASAQSARTTPSAAAPLSLLEVSQAPIVDPSPIHTDKPAPKTPAKTNKPAVATPSRPAPTGTAAVAHASPASPADYAEPPNSKIAFPLAQRPPSSSAKSVARPARNNPVAADAFDWNRVNALGFSADAPKDPAHLVPSQAQQGEIAMAPAPVPQPSVPTMVAEPDAPAQGTRGADTSWLLEMLGALTGGLVGGVIVWYLSGSEVKRVGPRESEEIDQPSGYHWASAYDNRRDPKERQEVDRTRGHNQSSAYDDDRWNTRERQEVDQTWSYNQTSAYDDRWDSRDRHQPVGYDQTSAYDDRWDSGESQQANRPRRDKQTASYDDHWGSNDGQEAGQPGGYGRASAYDALGGALSESEHTDNPGDYKWFSGSRNH